MARRPKKANLERLLKALQVPPGRKVNLRKDFDPGFTAHWIKKGDAEKALEEGIGLLAKMQDKLYAQDQYGLLVILQALDAAGKDGTIKHVMSGVNPQGVSVHSFKGPSAEELDHDYLWRNFLALPRRGDIGIFNRSYYEEVLVVRVHPEFLATEKLPPALKGRNIWKRRFEEINNFEKYLVNNGFPVLKFFLYASKQVQKKRFLERAELPQKNWKFSAADMRERQRWDDYIDAYEEVLSHTSTKWAPWYVVPADHKWFTRLAVAAVIYNALMDLDLAYPKVSREQKKELQEARLELENEGGKLKAAEETKPGKEGKQGKVKPAGKKSLPASGRKPVNPGTGAEIDGPNRGSGKKPSRSGNLRGRSTEAEKYHMKKRIFHSIQPTQGEENETKQ